MTFKQFQEEAKRTCPDLGSLKLNLIHMVLGMRTEIREYKDATDLVNALEEASDCVWYIANSLTFLDIDLAQLQTVPIYIEALLTKYENLISKIEFLVDEIQDICKKDLAYSKPYSESRLIDYLFMLCYLWDIEVKSFRPKMTLNQGLAKNIQKLRLRFPDKFDKTKAINRDHVAERKVLEDVTVYQHPAKPEDMYVGADPYKEDGGGSFTASRKCMNKQCFCDGSCKK